MQVILKRVLVFIAIALLFESALVAKNNTTKKRSFTVAIDPEYAPFTLRDADGKASGMFIDFWNLWAKKNGYTVTYRFYPWEETLTATRRGEVDFHSGTTNDESWMLSSQKIYQLSTSFFRKKDTPYLTRESLYNKRIGTIDAYYGKLAKKALSDKCEIVYYNDYAPLVKALEEGEIDVLIDDTEAVWYYLIKVGKMSKFAMIEDPHLITYNDIYAITNKSHPEIISLINEGLKKISREELIVIEKNWLVHPDSAFYWEGSNLKPQKPRDAKHHTWLRDKYLLLLLIGLFALYYIWRTKQQQNRAEALAVTDELTELPNKRAFNQTFEKQKKHKNAIALLFVDVDHFKAYNDHNGHLEDDRALKKIADILKRFTSERCRAYRIGGEEFALILNRYTRSEAEALASQICADIETEAIPHATSPYGHITVSIGVTWSDSGTEENQLYIQADKALYVAKNLGRNTIFVYKEQGAQKADHSPSS